MLSELKKASKRSLTEAVSDLRGSVQGGQPQIPVQPGAIWRLT